MYVLNLQKWKQIKEIKHIEYRKLMSSARIYDGRNIYNIEENKNNKILLNYKKLINIWKEEV